MRVSRAILPGRALEMDGIGENWLINVDRIFIDSWII